VSLLALSGRLGWLGWGAVVAVAYCGAASLGYWLGSVSTQNQPSAVWPAIGIAVVAVYLGGLRMAWAIVVGGLAAQLLRGAPFDESVANGLVSAVNPLVVTIILRAFDFRPSLARLRNAIVLIAACAVATPFGAALGTATILSFRDDGASAWVTWLTWWTGDFAGLLLVAPILFEVVDRTVLRRERLVASWPRSSAVVGAAAILALAVFTQDAPIAFLVIPVLLWAGLEGAPVIAATVSAVIVGIAWSVTVAGHGPLAGSTLTNNLIVLAAFTATVAISSLVLCAVAAERKRAYDEIGTAAAELESRVRARTAELRDAREEAERANRAKSGFLAAMSHEIRTPMIGVTGTLEVLARTQLTPHQRQMVATAESSAQSLLQIIGDILDFSKIEADKLQLAPATVDLRALVRAAADTFVHTASAKGLLLTCSTDDALAPAHVVDPLRLRQILSNFLSNAIKFTDVGGIEVAVRVAAESEEAQTVELSVIDTGVGVSSDQQRLLFEEFAQAQAATARGADGTGLGLVICKRLAVLMGGDVKMSSRLGKGTRIRLTVPLPVGDPAAVQAAPTVATTPASRPKPSRQQAEREGSLLLLADDHPVNRTVLRHQLNIAGFEVDVAEDGREALRLYERGHYGLVLTDLAMPGLSGYELAHAIRAHEATHGKPRTPIVALSANVMQGEPERCLAAGMDDFAGKPATIAFLTAKLRRWLPQLAWPAETPGVQLAATRDGDVDAALVEELTGGDPALAADLLRDFFETSRADLEALEEAIGARNHDAARRRAHRLKGASLTLGAHALSDLAQQIEDRAANGSGDWDRLRSLAAEVDEQLRQLAHATTADVPGA
jgi:signal transduction histidine kinase/CheY-like chemotaxis protein/HPt (histidine-containing phosphotransfer) domain-containing protein